MKRPRLWKLFYSTLYLSALTFGGGYVIVSLLKKKFVDEYGWIDDREMLELIAIAQSSPGSIAVNGAIVIGYKLAGAAGMLVSILATVLPPFVILSAISMFYTAFAGSAVVSSVLGGMQAGVCAVIASVVWEMGRGVVRERDALNIAVMALAFGAAYLLKANVAFVILASAAVGLLRAWIARGRQA